MSGFDNETVYANNYDFRGVQPVIAQVTTSGQLPIGTGASPAISVGSITSPLGTITVGYSNPNITIDLSGGSLGIDSIAVDASTAPGTNPVLPTAAGLMTITGAQVATGVVGSNVIRSNSIAANTFRMEIQRATTSATTNLAFNGVSHFNSTQFSVDSNAFVSIITGGFTWNNVTGTSATLVKQNGYQANNAGLVTLTLPTTASTTFGDTIKIMGFGAGGWTIAQLAGQQIIFGSSSTTVGVGGSLASSNRYDAVELVCSSTTGTWRVVSAVGSLTVT